VLPLLVEHKKKLWGKSHAHAPLADDLKKLKSFRFTHRFEITKENLAIFLAQFHWQLFQRIVFVVIKSRVVESHSLHSFVELFLMQQQAVVVASRTKCSQGEFCTHEKRNKDARKRKRIVEIIGLIVSALGQQAKANLHRLLAHTSAKNVAKQGRNVVIKESSILIVPVIGGERTVRQPDDQVKWKLSNDCDFIIKVLLPRPVLNARIGEIAVEHIVASRQSFLARERQYRIICYVNRHHLENFVGICADGAQ
jgi:hypothetical protein